MDRNDLLEEFSILELEDRLEFADSCNGKCTVTEAPAPTTAGQ
jgi:hypothetical protein